MLSGALTFWLLPGLGCRAGWLRLLQLNALPLLCGILALGVLAGMSGASQGRVGHYLMLLDPRQIVGAFHELSSQFAGSLKAKYSRDDAGLIIFFGLLAAVLIKFIKLLGPFALPFLSGGSWRMVQTYRQQFAPFAWAWGGYLAVLLVFFIHEQFINSRYLSFLDLLVLSWAGLLACGPCGVCCVSLFLLASGRRTISRPETGWRRMSSALMPFTTTIAASLTTRVGAILGRVLVGIRL